jgi:hypothetical protein
MHPVRTSVHRARRWTGLLATVSAVAIIAALLLVGRGPQAPESVYVLALDPQCDLQGGPCALVLPGGGRIELEITPRPIRVLEPMTLSVRLEGLAARTVEVDFSGVDMYMGYNRFALHPQSEGLYTGEGVLPICTEQRMPWEANVLVDAREGMLAAPFRFVTERR